MVERLRSFRGIRGVFRTHSNILGAASNKDNPRAHAVINTRRKLQPRCLTRLWIGILILYKTNMLQISFAKPSWAIWFPFPYFSFEGMYGTYLSSREMPNRNICLLQFFWNFPSLDVFEKITKKKNFYFDLSYRYILFVSFSRSFHFSFLSLFFVSLYYCLHLS